ncbi:MAG: hypothetical protein RBR68_13580 [Tenuifilaceae bacterium]|nr:hypothetical protein [Tenuifilaceae bacterium]
MSNKIAISDIHGNYIALQKLLAILGFETNFYGEYKNKNNNFLHFMGDLNDYTISQGRSSLRVINIVMQLVKQGYGECLTSNHQHKLIRYLKGNNVQLTNGLNNTAAELDYCSITEKAAILEFLKERPYYYADTINNKNYIFAHAYFDDLMFEYSLQENKTKKKDDWFHSHCIYGPNNQEGRIKWFEDSDFDKINKFKLIVSHYHFELYKDNFAVIDNEDCLVAYDITNEKIIRVSKYE